MKRILVGSDGSPAANDALAWAANLARSHKAELVVITCHLPVDDADATSPKQRKAAPELASWVAAADTKGLSVRTSIVEKDPRQGIVETAEELDVDLVVVGRTGLHCEGGPRALQLNSTVEYLAHHSDRALAVIPAGASARLGRITIGFDGSENSRAAASWAGDTAARSGAAIDVVSVWQPLVEWTRTDNPRHWRREHEEMVRRQWAEEIFERDLEVELHAIRGTRPAASVLRVATRSEADLIVLGMRGLGGFSGLRVGGVALRALHRARLPLVLVPSGL